MTLQISFNELERADMVRVLGMELTDKVNRVFENPSSPMVAVDLLAKLLLPDLPHIIWEADAATFQFTYVSDSAEGLLGYPVASWLEHPTFWADQVVYPPDAADAVAYCALATGSKRDHAFFYRAQAQDGSIRYLYDIVRVVMGENSAARLRGIMIEVSSAEA